jgi:hypothetical protein
LRLTQNLGARVAILVAAYAAGLLVLEGLASFTLAFFSSNAEQPRALGEVRHSAYDPELGWAHIPNLRVDDIYGEGIYLETNSQGLRATRDFTPQVPEGRIRVVCSGDSFTLGYGVSNDETWCELLNGLDERLETVNMGQGGYGLDQAYLWYLRDGEALEHDALLFAFITEDFQRLRHREFVGYGKPLIRLVDGQLVVSNQPVPEFGPRLRRALRGLAYLRELRLSSLLEAGIAALRSPSSEGEMSEQEMYEIAGMIFKNLQRISAEQGRQLALVHLPTKEDYPSTDSVEMRRWLAAGSARHGITYIDLVEDFNQVPVPDVTQFFRAAHYSTRGNHYIADRLHRALVASQILPDPQESDLTIGAR